jgi:hypothetical protein
MYLINYNKCKIEFTNNGLNMLKVELFNLCTMMMVEEIQKKHQLIIMHCANNVKGYPNFCVNNLKLFFKKRFKLYPYMNNVMNIITINNIDIN